MYDTPWFPPQEPPEPELTRPKDGLTQLKGTVEHIIYSNEDNGYTVMDVGLEDDVITACGIMPYVSDGDSLILWGNWVHNPKYGRQFKVEQYERDMPADSAAILRYLSSRTIMLHPCRWSCPARRFRPPRPGGHPPSGRQGPGAGRTRSPQPPAHPSHRRG